MAVERFTPEINHKRRLDSDQIAAQRELFGTAVASMAFFTKGNDVETCLAHKEKVMREFDEATRNQRIERLLRLESFYQGMSGILNPGVDESSIAYQTRRMDLISRIVKAGLADGMVAVDTADLLMGNFRFVLEGNDLMRYGRESMSVIAENSLKSPQI